MINNCIVDVDNLYYLRLQAILQDYENSLLIKHKFQQYKLGNID